MSAPAGPRLLVRPMTISRPVLAMSFNHTTTTTNNNNNNNNDNNNNNVNNTIKDTTTNNNSNNIDCVYLYV